MFYNIGGRHSDLGWPGPVSGENAHEKWVEVRHTGGEQGEGGGTAQVMICPGKWW